MRKIKIVSYGRYTRVEVNGKTLEGVEALCFEHDTSEKVDRKDKKAKLHLDLDLEDFGFAEDGEIDRWEAAMDAAAEENPAVYEVFCERGEAALDKTAKIAALAIEKAAAARDELKKREKEKCAAIFEETARGGTTDLTPVSEHNQ